MRIRGPGNVVEVHPWRHGQHGRLDDGTETTSVAVVCLLEEVQTAVRADGHSAENCGCGDGDEEVLHREICLLSGGLTA